MSRITFRSSVCLALQMTLVALFAKQSSAQTFTAPPAPSPGSTGNSLVINGNVTIDRLTLNVNFFPGNGVGVTVNSGTASLTNTTVNLGTSGGVKGLVANGPAATLTLGAGSSVNASGGGGGNFRGTSQRWKDFPDGRRVCEYARRWWFFSGASK